MPAVQRRPEWRPLASGDVQEKARRTVRQLAAELEAGPSPVDCSLAYGTAGLALAFAHLAGGSGTSEGASTADRFLDLAIATLANAPLGVGLSQGLLGVGWAFAHVSAIRGEPAGDALEQLDDTVRRWIEGAGAGSEFDLTRGLVGAGMYALERLPDPAGRRCLEATVEALARRAEHGPEGARWLTRTTHAPPLGGAPGEHYDLGVAHGVGGVIGLLGATVRAGVAVATAEPLLRAAVRWLLAQARDDSTDGRFPPWVVSPIRASPRPRLPSRVAWCYGDLGIAGVLLAAAEALDEPAWRSEAVETARRAARRRSPAEAGVVDAGLCHGAAGVAHVFGRLAIASGDDELADAALFWLERTLDMQVAGAPLRGYRALVRDDAGKPAWEADRGLLTGAAGVALALHAATADREPSWDRFMLMAPPGVLTA